MASLLAEFPPVPKPETEDDKIWTKILEDVSSETSKINQGSAIFLGKSTLVSRMVGQDRVPIPSVCEYSFITVHANEDNRQAYQITSQAALFGAHDSTNLPLWIYDGTEKWRKLFEFAFPKSLSKCVFVLCASLSQPGKVLDSLNSWYKMAEEEIKVHYTEEQIKESKAEQMKFWQEYVEPAESMYIDTTEFKAEMLEPEMGVLTESCGAIVIVVLTKVDEKPFTSAEDLSRLQYQVRQFCLRHGAALVYTSGKTDTNTALLRKYISHRVYGVPFTKPAHIVDDASIFIPSGWDSLKKLDAERETLTNPEQPVQNGNEELPLSGREKPVECQDEQDFLQQLGKALAADPASPKRDSTTAPVAPAAATAGPSPLANYFGSLIKNGSSPRSTTTSSLDATAHFQRLAGARPSGPTDPEC